MSRKPTPVHALFALILLGLIAGNTQAAPQPQTVTVLASELEITDQPMTAQLVAAQPDSVTQYLRAWADGHVATDIMAYEMSEETTAKVTLSVDSNAVSPKTKTVKIPAGTNHLVRVIDVDWGRYLKKGDTLSSCIEINGETNCVTAVLLSSPVFMVWVPQNVDDNGNLTCGGVIEGHNDPDVEAFMNNLLVHVGFYPDEDWVTEFIKYINEQMITITATAKVGDKLRAQVMLGTFENPCFTPATETPEPTPITPTPVTPTPTTPPDEEPNNQSCIGTANPDSTKSFRVCLPLLAKPPVSDELPPTLTPTPTVCAAHMFAEVLLVNGQWARVDIGDAWMPGPPTESDRALQAAHHPNAKMRIKTCGYNHLLLFSFYDDARVGIHNEYSVRLFPNSDAEFIVIPLDPTVETIITVDFLDNGRYSFGHKPGPDGWDTNFMINWMGQINWLD